MVFYDDKLLTSKMIVFVVAKAPVDLEGTTEFIGAFSNLISAEAACRGAGTYTIARMELGRCYSGDLRDVSIKVVLDARQFF